ncbi:hypothetical protein OOT46_08100 [Aquabacterium sp. A7-Y]|uniref:hypothetical protein n=1 Tax=Aquabacterium sp. A7-Y TaxID=1349605 RepID=UPI00223E1148|nr:hypothetical protein [Aquabacterium sp. A7-Y]MCW7537811.1 hypothetical protein [Aquabacterium sp. A7-Y]
MTTRVSRPFPLRKVVGTLDSSEVFPLGTIVILECGHTVASTARDSTRCPKCWAGAPPDCEPADPEENGTEPPSSLQ